MQATLLKTQRLFRDAYSGHPPQIWVIAWLTLINRSGTMVIPFLSVYLSTELNYTASQVGFLVSGFGFGSLIGSYFGGQLSDRFGANKIIVGSLLLGGLGFLLLQFTIAFWPLFTMILLTSMFGDAYRPAMTASAAAYVPSEQFGRTMAFLRIAINLGMTIAPLVGGVVAVSFGYKWLFWIDGLTCIAGGLYFLNASKNWRSTQEIAKDQNEVATQNGQATPNLLLPHRNPAYLLFLFSSLLLAFSFVQWFHTVPVFLKTVWGYDERYYGLLMAICCGLIVLIEMPLIHYIETKRLVKMAVRTGIALIGISFLVFWMPALAIWGIAGGIILTLGEILFLPFNHAKTVTFSPPHLRGVYQSWYFMMWSLSSILGPLVGFAIADQWGYSALWLCLLGCIAVSLLLYLRIER